TGEGVELVGAVEGNRADVFGDRIKNLRVTHASPSAQRTQRISVASSVIGTNTARTGSPMRMLLGSTLLIAALASVTRLPTRRIWGASSSSTTITGYGAKSLKAGSRGGCGTVNDQMRPHPASWRHCRCSERQAGHIGRGGNRSWPHSAQACI